MRKIISLIALIISLVTVSGCAAQTPTVHATQPASQTVCEEDQPCWDCVVMGNHMCGPDQSVEAWKAFDQSVDTEDLRADSQAYTVRYIGTNTLDGVDIDHHAIVGVETGTPNVFHLFVVTDR